VGRRPLQLVTIGDAEAARVVVLVGRGHSPVPILKRVGLGFDAGPDTNRYAPCRVSLPRREQSCACSPTARPTSNVDMQVNAAINMPESLYLAFVLAQSAHPTGRRPSGVQIRHWRRHRGEILGAGCLGVAHGLGGDPPYGLPAERGDGLILDFRFSILDPSSCTRLRAVLY
jgi:hypothetical protein